MKTSHAPARRRRFPIGTAAFLVALASCAGEGGLDTSFAGGPCESSGDCPIGAKYCVPDDSGEGVCRATLDTGHGACGVVPNELGIGAACDSPTCPASARCAEAPSIDATFCTVDCASDADCGSHAFCGDTGASAGVCIPYACACAATTAETSLLQPALSQAGKTTCDLGQAYGALSSVYADDLAHDALRPTFYQRLYHSPLAIPPARRRLRDRLTEGRGAGRAVSDSIRIAGELWDESPGAIAAPTRASFEEALLSLWAGPREISDTLRRELLADAADLPPGLQAELAPVLVALRRAADLRNRAVPADPDARARLFDAPMGMFWAMREVIPREEKIDLSRKRDRELLFEEMRYSLLVEAAVIVAEAVEGADLTRPDLAGSYSFNQVTPLGRIVISGSGNDVYADADATLTGPLLLVVDTGGDDHYEIPVGGTNSPDAGVAIAIDGGGDDVYTHAKVPDYGDVKRRPDSDAAGRRPTVPRHSLSTVRRQGSGTLGVGMLFDLGAGRDRYESNRFSQGCGILGVGVLYDGGGDDAYHAELMVQGAGQFGVGLLIDEGGSDIYEAFSLAQAGVHVKAVGMLVDHAGNDTYWTSPGISYIGPDGRDPAHDYLYEYGVTQGASWGRRGDFAQDFIKNGVSSSGGVAALFDLAGDDSYTCGVFCQGNGYWFGTGMLVDEGGNDRYYARMFAGGSGVHFGLGVAHDGAGDDSYYEDASCIGLTLGGADDLSLAWFEDGAGNDRYRGCKHSMGAAAENGVGVFLDHSGDDQYRSGHYMSFGAAFDPHEWHAPSHRRYGLETSGTFVDGEGLDSYERRAFYVPEPIANGASWMHPWHGVESSGTFDLDSPPEYKSPEVFAVGADVGSAGP